jgi:hypothetical protein
LVLPQGRPGFTKRRDGVLSGTGAYRTSFPRRRRLHVFALRGGVASPRRSTRVTPRPAPRARPGLRIQGPVTAPRARRLLTAAARPGAVTCGSAGRASRLRAAPGGRAGRHRHLPTSYTADLPHEYFVKSSTVTSADATTLVGEVPNGLDVTAPAGVEPGRTVEVIVQGEAGERVEVWFARRGEGAYTRRRDAELAADGTFRTSFVANDEYSYFATSGGRTSKRVRTRLTRLPELVPAAAPRLAVSAPKAVEAGSSVPVTVSGPAGAAVELWFRRRGSETWSRLREGRFDVTGRWSTSYAGVDDHEYWASSGGRRVPGRGHADDAASSAARPAPAGREVQLAGRARPGDQRRRRVPPPRARPPSPAPR